MARNGRGSAAEGGQRSPSSSRARPAFAAVDLGTNNCRLLIAEPDGAGFRVVDGYSEIVRLGEGLSASGQLSEAAMARAYKALAVVAGKISGRAPVAVGCIATQALRSASNGVEFLDRVRADLGLEFRVIGPGEEAKLAVLGCAALVDAASEAALIVDIGGGSTELSWVEPKAVRASMARGELDPPIRAWVSTTIGVVTLADSMPESGDIEYWYETMVRDIAGRLASAPAQAQEMRHVFGAGGAHIVGTSGAVTSLAALHLGLKRYKRAEVDGLWMSEKACRAVCRQLRAMSPAERAANPCIGKDRADLVVPGAAILEAVCRLWPVARIRVADRGLREGVLMQLMAAHKRGMR